MRIRLTEAVFQRVFLARCHLVNVIGRRRKGLLVLLTAVQMVISLSIERLLRTVVFSNVGTVVHIALLYICILPVELLGALRKDISQNAIHLSLLLSLLLL